MYYMKNLFNTVKVKTPGYNRFDLSHDIKLSMKFGYLYPTCIMDCVPGDRFKLGCDSLIRFSPMLAPVMHRIDATVHYFFVPNRIIWPGWEDFITNANPLPAFPTLTVGGLAGENYSVLDNYLGIPKPPDNEKQEVVSALAHAAYQCVYNEYYRDQNLVNEINYTLIDGDNTGNAELRALRLRAWEHDYFTASLPFAQKGQEVTLPLSDFNNVLVGVNNTDDGDATTGYLFDATKVPSSAGATAVGDRFNVDDVPTGNLMANTSELEAQAATINNLRRAFRLQEWLEKAARGGSRYIETILAHFGVRSSDKRLQRPEYITGVKSPVVISEVLNTTGTEENPQGNMAGHGISVAQGKYGTYRCEEFGYIIGIMSIIPKTAYQNGLPKHFLKTTSPFDYYWPEFANIGEQEVLNKEVYAFDNTGGNNVFGYVPRYAEYKFMQNRVAGDFQDDLDFWHLGRVFTTPQQLNELFIRCEPSTRIFAVETGEDYIYAHVLNKVDAIRPMPKYGTPTF